MDVEKRNAEKTMIDLYAGVCLPKCEVAKCLDRKQREPYDEQIRE